MTNLDFDITQWYNEDDLDYSTPEPQMFDSHASPADTRLAARQSHAGTVLATVGRLEP